MIRKPTRDKKVPPRKPTNISTNANKRPSFLQRHKSLMWMLGGLFLGVCLSFCGVYYKHDIAEAAGIPTFEKLLPAFNVSNDTLLMQIGDALGLPSGQQKIYDMFGWETPNLTAAFPHDYVPRHPVAFLPGIVSTGLELWAGKECAKRYFRQRMWGTLTMMESMLINRKCWIEHMMLNPETGLDPKSIKLRPAVGMEAADYLMPGIWIWGRIIEALASIGYDSNNMYMLGYDWRLSFHNVEARDSELSKLKQAIELLKITNNEKVVLISHSMGGPLLFYFFNWVQSDLGGRGGSSWVNDNIHAVVSICAPWLGTAKAISSVISGEMRDTAQLDYLVDAFFSKLERRDLFRSWGSIASLLPMGGNSIWGDLDASPDDSLAGIVHLDNGTSFTVEQIINWIQREYPAMANYSFGNKAEPWMKDDPFHWSNPLEVPLPNAPEMTIYCLYGVGKTTERFYFYNSQTPEGFPTIDTKLSNSSTKVTAGVGDGDGDGTVPLISLGYMPVKGWIDNPTLNPSGIKIVTKEYKHLPGALNPRGGHATADHVDVMGNTQVLYDILHVASGHESNVKEVIVSNIKEIAYKVKI